ncbi:MAG: TlpA family protein disulfide reductase, partial [Saprospiraceae bacterium]|nr:TlpA family protein disulfide reductase [Saprospiraceae bacterium]
YQGRPKIIQILGTWCPNCLDETDFLVDWLDEHPDLDIAVIGLAFERYDDPAKARKVISRYREKLGITYPILHAGKSNKREASKQLPMLNEIISYPTLIFLDRNNQVRRIHTGFNGPATPDYPRFIEEFEETIQELLDQPGI